MRAKIKIHVTDQNISQLTNQNSDQSKFKLTLTNQKLSFDVVFVQLYVTQPRLHTCMQTRHSANQSMRTILVIL